jgi:hypothetical protein
LFWPLITFLAGFIGSFFTTKSIARLSIVFIAFLGLGVFYFTVFTKKDNFQGNH